MSIKKSIMLFCILFSSIYIFFNCSEKAIIGNNDDDNVVALEVIPASWNGDYADQNYPDIIILKIHDGKIFSYEYGSEIEIFPAKNKYIGYEFYFSEILCSATKDLEVVKYKKDLNNGKITIEANGATVVVIKYEGLQSSTTSSTIEVETTTTTIELTTTSTTENNNSTSIVSTTTTIQSASSTTLDVITTTSLESSTTTTNSNTSTTEQSASTVSTTTTINNVTSTTTSNLTTTIIPTTTTSTTVVASTSIPNTTTISTTQNTIDVGFNIDFNVEASTDIEFNIDF